MKTVIKWSIIIDAILIASKFLGAALGKVIGLILSVPLRLLSIIPKVNLSGPIAKCGEIGTMIASPLTKFSGFLKYALIIEGILLAFFLITRLLNGLKRKSVQNNISQDVQQEYSESMASQGNRGSSRDMNEF